MVEEQIVFVNRDGTPTGEYGPKLTSHTAHTKLHLGFSCYIFRKSDGAFLLTQRAKTKKVWPGVWSNSVCGHPMPGESLKHAIKRRSLYELGIDSLEKITCIMPNYQYKTPPYKGIIENEFCPIFVAVTSGSVNKNSKEVEAYRWVPWLDYVTAIKHSPGLYSYWSKDQYALIQNLQPFSSM